jgi:hypothetical protein
MQVRSQAPKENCAPAPTNVTADSEDIVNRWFLNWQQNQL